MIGRRFSRLVLQEDNEHAGTTKRYVRVICDCGVEKEVRLDHLISGSTKSCGCLLRDLFKKQAEERLAFSRLYNTWSSMKQRCYNPKNNRYCYYGGKGISVCNDWIVFGGFKKWALESGYKEGMTVDRIDPSKNYSPDNCQWLSKSDNNSKRFDDSGGRKVLNHHIIFANLLKSFGITFVISANNFGIKPGTLVAAIHRNKHKERSK